MEKRVKEIEEIIGKEMFEKLKKSAKDNNLNSSKYYLLAEELKTLVNINIIIANLLDVINETI